MRKKYILFILIAAISAGIYWQKSNIESYLDNYIRRELKTQTKGRVMFDRVAVGFTTFKLINVRLNLPNQSSTIYVENLEIGFDLVNFFKQEFELPAIVENISVRNGFIKIHPSPSQTNSGSSYDESDIDEISENLFTLWKTYAKSQKIVLDNFEVLLDLDEAGVKPIVRGLDGYAFFGSEKIELELNGRLLYSPHKNTNLKGFITHDSLNFALNWSKIDLQRNWPFKNLDNLTVKDGLFSGRYYFRAAMDDLANFSVSGKAVIKNIAFRLNDLEFSKGMVTFRPKRKSRLKIIYSGNIFTNHFSGLFDLNYFYPSRSFGRIHADIAELSQLSKALQIPLINGHGKFSASASLKSDTLSWQGELKIIKPELLSFTADTLYGNLSGSTKNIRIQRVIVIAGKNQFFASGLYDITRQNGHVTTNFEGEIPQDLGPLYVKPDRYHFSATINLEAGSDVNGVFSGKLGAIDDDPAVAGHFEYQDDHFILSFEGDSVKTISGEMVYWKPLLLDPRFRGEVIFPGNLFKSFDDRFSLWPQYVKIQFDGDYEQMDMDIDGFFNPDNNLSVNGEYEKTDGGYRFLGMASMNINGESLEGPIDWHGKKNGTVDAHMQLANGIYIDYQKYSSGHEAQLRFDDIDVTPFTKKIMPEIQGGILHGDLDIKSNIDGLNLLTHFHAEKLLLNDVGYYNLEIDASLADSLLKIDKMNLTLNNNPILTVLGNANITAPSYHFSIEGSDIDMEYLTETFLGPSVIGAGRLNLTADLSSNEYGQPFVKFEGQALNGNFEEFPFDTLSMVFDFGKIDDFWNLNLKHFSWEHDEDIDFFANGQIPFSDREEMSASLSFNGDFLKYLPKLDSFFTYGRSQTRFDLTLAGTYYHPLFLQGKIEIDNGSLGMNAVIDDIENIHLSVEKKQGDEFVHIQDLYAEVLNSYLKAHTVRNVSLKERKLENWKSDNLGLDFGILIIETSDNGVPLKIFGPMREGESGRVKLTGREGEEGFYFAGPAKRPVARGMGIVSDLAFVYPFLQRPGNRKSTPAERFLESIDWDILAYAGTNVTYNKEVSAYLDEVVIDISVNPSKSMVEINGSIGDESFVLDGKAVSNSGILDYLDFSFKVEEFGIIFNSNKTEPEVYGEAVTTVRDSLGSFPKDIYLRLYSKDAKSGEEKSGGDWSELSFKLESPGGIGVESEGDALASLGYSGGNIKGKATTIGGKVTDNLIFRPLIRPVERNLERWLRLDVVRVNAVFASNIFSSSLNNGLDIVPGSNDIYGGQINGLSVFNRSQLTVGKYVLDDLYLSYTGELVSLYENTGIGFSHKFGLEYRLFNNVLFEFEYDLDQMDYNYIYYPQGYNDFRLRIRHSINF